MIRLKRVISLILALLMIVVMCACNKDKDGTETTTKANDTDSKATAVVRLPYSREDGVNPFAAKSLLNDSIMPLLYEGLFTVDSTYAPKKAIAGECKVEGDTVTISLNPSKRFSDGTSVSADDVVYSYNSALTSTYYATSLSSILSITAVNSNTLVVKVATANIYVASILTFPIVKQGTASTGTDDIPVGTGKYVYTNTAEGGELTSNAKYGASSYSMEKVILVNMTDSESLMFGLVIGNFDATFDDLSKGATQRINASSVQVPTNNLVYLGLNVNGVFANPILRQQLNAYINRDDLLSSGFEGYGITTISPFPQKWYGEKNVTPLKLNAEAAEDFLSDNLKGTVNILVNSDNNFKVKFAEDLASQLSQAGINTKLTSVPYDSYLGTVAAGGYDIYVGEYKLTNDMNISALIIDEELRLQYAEMLAGNIKCSDFLTAFYEKQPFIPVCYRNGVLAYSRSVETKVSPTPGNPYANLNEWFI